VDPRHRRQASKVRHAEDQRSLDQAVDHQLVLRRIDLGYAAVVNLEVERGRRDDTDQILKRGSARRGRRGRRVGSERAYGFLERRPVAVGSSRASKRGRCGRRGWRGRRAPLVRGRAGLIAACRQAQRTGCTGEEEAATIGACERFLLARDRPMDPATPATHATTRSRRPHGHEHAGTDDRSAVRSAPRPRCSTVKRTSW
jgi:hypothetical protein